jgi:hypothetical protein
MAKDTGMSSDASVATLAQLSDTLPDRDHFDNVLAQANDGVPGAVESLRELLEEHPQIWQQVGDLNRHTVMTLVRMIAGENILIQQSITKAVAQLVDDLADTAAPVMAEKLLISRVVCSWLECQLAITVSANLGTESLVRSRFHLKLRESSQRRFESSVLALQQFRRREVDLARLKCRVIRDARKAQIDYQTMLASEYPWIC